MKFQFPVSIYSSDVITCGLGWLKQCALLIEHSNCIAFHFVCLNCTLLLLSFTSKIYAAVQCLAQARPGCICCFLGRVLKVDQDAE